MRASESPRSLFTAPGSGGLGVIRHSSREEVSMLRVTDLLSAVYLSGRILRLVGSLFRRGGRL